MNKLFAVLLIFICHISVCRATIHTLCNMPYSPGMYKTFDAAQSAAVDGDTIYVHGSTISYGDITVEKALVIIGTGHHPDKQNALVSGFQAISIIYSSVKLIGLTFNYLVANVSNITIKKCRILGSNLGFVAAVMLMNGGGGCLIEGNIFDLNANYFEHAIEFFNMNAANTIIRNNIFSGGRNKIKGIENSGSQLTYVVNNVFLGNNSNNALEYLRKVVIDNNIFIASSPSGAYMYECQMNNNISYYCMDNSFSQPGFNNLVDVDPQFINFPTPGNMFTYNYDFRLANTSPGHNTGLDGTDRGVYGGVGLKFSMTGEPSIASVTAFSITSPATIAPNGTLTISVTSKRIH